MFHSCRAKSHKAFCTSQDLVCARGRTKPPSQKPPSSKSKLQPLAQALELLTRCLSASFNMAERPPNPLSIATFSCGCKAFTPKRPELGCSTMFCPSKSSRTKGQVKAPVRPGFHVSSFLHLSPLSPDGLGLWLEVPLAHPAHPEPAPRRKADRKWTSMIGFQRGP